MNGSHNAEMTMVITTAAAVSAANAANRHACEDLMQGYAHNTAAEAEMREYAACVHRLHPHEPPFAGVDPLGLKLIVVALLLFPIVGAVIGSVEAPQGKRIKTAFEAALVFFFYTLLAVLFLSGAWLGIRFILTA